MYFNRVTIPIPLDGRALRLDPSFLLAPLLSLATLNYASRMVRKVLKGEAVEPLARGINWVGVATFILLLSRWEMVPEALHPLSLMLFYLALVSAASSTLKPYLKRLNEALPPVLNSGVIIASGIIVAQAWSNAYPELFGSPDSARLLALLGGGLAEKVNTIILAGAAVTATLSLFGVARNHPNPYISFLGRRLGEGLGGKLLLSLILLAYALFVRGMISEMAGAYSQYIPIAEWVGVCIAFYAMYGSLRGYVSEELVVQERLGDWRSHIQQIELVTNYKLDRMSGIVEDFIERGAKEELVVSLSLILNKARLSPEAITNTLDELINYEDREPGAIAFAWQIDHLKAENRRRRWMVMENLMSSTRLGHAAVSAPSEAAPEGAQIREV